MRLVSFWGHLLLASTAAATSLEVDLGYQVYRGVFNPVTGLNNWYGIRFAAPPTGPLRWQAPQPPAPNRTLVAEATTFGPSCMQNAAATDDGPGSPEDLDAMNSESSEDCLFLNVHAPSGAAEGSLPVLVWIHGGGYGAGSGRADFSPMLAANKGKFVAVSIQYRLGAFGFLASDEVYRNGALNVGILDQQFALKWVQSHIRLFGGDPSQVTISGESAGGGSVMLHGISYGGSLGDTLFTNAIAASPYLPMQYGYKDWVPSQAYYAFAIAAGCAPTLPHGRQVTPTTIFQCLVAQNSSTLSFASAWVSGSGKVGTLVFLPVTDGDLLPEAPSQALLKKRVNGRNLLVGNNADEGSLFVQSNITTEADLVNWLRLTFPMFSSDDIAKVLLYYPTANAPADDESPHIARGDYEGTAAAYQNAEAPGQQERANNIYSETTFVCPSYWMAEAYSGASRSSFKYQYSVGAATHGADMPAFFGLPWASQGPDFELAFQTIWGKFITTGNPSIPAAIANGAAAEMSTEATEATNPATLWPAFTIHAPIQLNLNETECVSATTQSSNGDEDETDETGHVERGPRNDFSLVNAYTWEGGRGYRCDFWRSLGVAVPE